MDLKNGPFLQIMFWSSWEAGDLQLSLGFIRVSVVKNMPVIVGNPGDAGSIPGLGQSPGGGHGTPPQYSCLENPMDKGAYGP